jgi:hypothetical protein
VGFGAEEGMARKREENESFCLLTCCSVSERRNKRYVAWSKGVQVTYSQTCGSH